MEYSSNPIERLRQQRAMFLAAMYDAYIAAGGNVYQTLWLQKVGEQVGLVDWQQMWALASYLAEKGFIKVDGGGATGRMTVSGIDAIEHARLPIGNAKETTTAQAASLVVNGTIVGGIQFQSPASTQNISIAATKVDESIEKLRRLVGQSAAGDLDKEDAAAALDRLQQLAKKEKSGDVLSRANEKLQLVKSTLETVKAVYELAQPYLNILAAHFALSH